MLVLRSAAVLQNIWLLLKVAVCKKSGLAAFLRDSAPLIFDWVYKSPRV